MRIGELAKRSGCDVGTIRFYEKSGLLPESGRNCAGYRLYRAEHLQRLELILHCKSLKMGLANIRLLLDFRSLPSTEARGVSDLLEHHIGLIRVEIKALQSLELQLIKLWNQCDETYPNQK